MIFYVSDKYFKTVDTIGTRLIPVSILNEFNMDLDEFFGSPENYLEGIKEPGKDDFLEVTQDGKRYYHSWIITIQKGKFYTSFPIVFPIINLPFYVIAKLFIKPFTVSLIDLANFKSWINKLDNFISSFWTALGGLFLFSLIYKDHNFQKAFFINLVYCLATPAFSLLSHNTWQHTLIVPIIFLVLLLLESKDNKKHYFVGILLGLLPFIRPTAIFFFPLLFLIEKKYIKEWLIGAIISGGFFLFLHMYIYSHPLGGYYYHTYKLIRDRILSPSFLDAFIGLLFSPSRGLFVFMPFLMVVFISIFILFLKEIKLRKKILILISPFLLHLIFYSTSGFWHGGWSYGPRYLSDNLPIFMILFFMAYESFWRNKLFRASVIITLIISFFIHIQPSFSKEFLKWEECYNHPQGYIKKIMDWSNPVFLANFKLLKILLNKEVILDYKDLCSFKEEVNKEGNIHFSKDDYMSLIKINDKYLLFLDNTFYFTSGNYEFEIQNPSSELTFLMYKNNKKIIEKKFENGHIDFMIDQFGKYTFFILIDRPIEYDFSFIRIKRI